MSTAARRIVVFGGSGFLGSRVCRYAAARNWAVTSVSRSGEPEWKTVTASYTPPPWAHKVSWERADIFKPEHWSPFLKGADYVVQSMGILLEADYKGVLQGKQSPISGLQKAFSAGQGSSSPNPLDRKEGEAPRAPESSGQLTYELMNRDSAVLVAREAAREKVGAYAYISAAGGAPILPSRYIATKREAERIIANEFPEVRGVFIRPPFLYDSSRSITMPLAAMSAAGAAFNSLTGGVLSDFLGAAGAKPLKADDVAQAVVEALSDEDVRGVIEVPQIEALASKFWRKTML